jgi:hypothetical protein
MHLLACGASDKVMSVVSHAGFGLSTTATYAMKESIAKKSGEALKALAATNTAGIVYDNLNVYMTAPEGSLFKSSENHNLTAATFIEQQVAGDLTESLKVTKSLLSISPLNPHRTPEAIASYVEPTYKNLLKAASSEGLRPFEAVKEDLISQILRIMIETVPGLEEHQAELEKYRKPIFKLPLYKTKPIPTRAIDEDEGTLSGNSAVLIRKTSEN